MPRIRFGRAVPGQEAFTSHPGGRRRKWIGPEIRKEWHMTTDPKRLTLEEAHEAFAAGYNGKVWDLLMKSDRTPEEGDVMLHMAHASCAHWLSAGDETHHQRGEWMIARVNTVLGFPEAALRHAKACMDLTMRYPGKMEDFDRAYAFEALARAHALAGNSSEAALYLRKSEEAGALILGDENKDVFNSDLASGDWYGLT